MRHFVGFMPNFASKFVTRLTFLSVRELVADAPTPYMKRVRRPGRQGAAATETSHLPRRPHGCRKSVE
jgi:hypothetical protein